MTTFTFPFLDFLSVSCFSPLTKPFTNGTSKIKKNKGNYMYVPCNQYDVEKDVGYGEKLVSLLNTLFRLYNISSE